MLANLPRLRAEESLRSLRDAKSETKARYRDLLAAATGDVEFAEKVWRDLVIRDRESRMDGGT